MKDYSNDTVWRKVVVSVGTLESFVLEVSHRKGSCRVQAVVVPFSKVPDHQRECVVVGAEPTWVHKGNEGFELDFGNDGSWWERAKAWIP